MARQPSPKTKQTKSASQAQGSRSRTGLADRKPTQKTVARKPAGGAARGGTKTAGTKAVRPSADGASGKRTPQPGTAPSGVSEEVLRRWADFKDPAPGLARERR